MSIMKTPAHWYRHENHAHELILGYIGTGIKDKSNAEIFEGDTLSIDFEGAAKVIGGGSLISDITASKPTPDARLTVEFNHARFRLVWRTENGGIDTGKDLALLVNLSPFIEIEEAA